MTRESERENQNSKWKMKTNAHLLREKSKL